MGAPLRRIVKSLQICACPGHHSGAGLLEHVSDPEERRLCAPRARLCAFPMFMALSPGLSALARLGVPSLGLCALSGTPLCGQPVLSLDYEPPPSSTAPPRGETPPPLSSLPLPSPLACPVTFFFFFFLIYFFFMDHF